VRPLADPFRPFAARLAPGRPVAVLCHSDCDGLAAGTVLAKALERAGHAVAVEVTGKGGSAWNPEVAPRLARHDPQALLVADLGCRSEPVLPGVPTCFIDHHRPEGVPPGAVLVTGYGTDPTPTSGQLAWECGEQLADVADLDWVVAISVLSDLGDKAPFAVLTDVRKTHKITHLRDATALLNAARRSATGDAAPALGLLMKADGPKAVLSGGHPETEELKAMKAEVAAAFAEAKKAGPRFARKTNVALVRVHSPCQVHPMVVPIWRTRLPRQIVMVANTGYLPGRVNFTMRTGTATNLIEFLKAHAPPDPGPNYGHGHDQATGGALAFDQWNRFAAGLGFGPEARVDESWSAGVSPASSAWTAITPEEAAGTAALQEGADA
jgi:single-stranded-DNA-specific exonuclease